MGGHANFNFFVKALQTTVLISVKCSHPEIITMKPSH